MSVYNIYLSKVEKAAYELIRFFWRVESRLSELTVNGRGFAVIVSIFKVVLVIPWKFPLSLNFTQMFFYV